MTFSFQAEGGGDTERSRWQLVDDFVTNIKEHRAARVSPSELICVDESMCKWYGQGGYLIRKGLPCTLQLTVRPKMDVKSKMRHAGGVDLYCGSAS